LVFVASPQTHSIK